MKMSPLLILMLCQIILINNLRINSSMGLKVENLNSEDKKEDKKEEPKKEDKKEEPKKDDAKKDDAKKDATPADANAAKNDTAKEEKKDVIQYVTQPPFNITNPAQIIQYEGNTLSNHADYTTSNKAAFFTMSAVSINMYPAKDSHELLESIGLQYVSEQPYVLLGSAKCLIFKDGRSFRNITMCCKTVEDTDSIIKAFMSFRALRNAEWEPDNPFAGRIVRASCDGIQKPDGQVYDYLETQKIFKAKLEAKGLTIKQDSINPEALANIKETEERIRAQRLITPGAVPNVLYDVFQPLPIRNHLNKTE
ncbi:MAG: hypothetical protein MJ252_15075 [archaeon]|nr:hypothetical protein [archaeon]